MDIAASQSSSTADINNTASTSSSTAESAPPQIALSLYGIARRHCREEIIISPLRWTGRHLELLQCSFSKPLPEPVTAAANSVTEADYSKERSGTPHLHEFFHYYYKALFREQGIRLLLTTDGCPLTALFVIPFSLSHTVLLQACLTMHTVL